MTTARQALLQKLLDANPPLKLHLPLLQRTELFKDDSKAHRYAHDVNPVNEDFLIYMDAFHLILKTQLKIDMDQV